MHGRRPTSKKLPDVALDWLAVLLNAIEAGGDWPEWLLHGKASHLEKDGGGASFC